MTLPDDSVDRHLHRGMLVRNEEELIESPILSSRCEEEPVTAILSPQQRVHSLLENKKMPDCLKQPGIYRFCIIYESSGADLRENFFFPSNFSRSKRI